MIKYEDFKPKFTIDFEFWDDRPDGKVVVICHSLVQKGYKSICFTMEMSKQEFDDMTMEDIIKEARKWLFEQHK